MSNKIKILFIVNPISGIGKQNKFEEILKNNIDYQRFDVEISYTQYAGHAVEIAKNAVNKYDVVTAVGGDGSINEIASQLQNTETALAVIPCGSGNGFARTFNIPLKPDLAIKFLNKAQFRKIDTCLINDKFFISIAGVGFDSLVARKYEEMPTRGFKTYFKAGFNSFFKYKEVEYTLIYNGKEEKCKAFLITACNSQQYGYDFKIAPNAKTDDGLLDIAIVHRPPLYRIPFTAISVMSGHANNSKYIDIIQAEELIIKGNDCGFINLDGETIKCEGDLVFKTRKQNLKMLV
ncbi:MAG: diacylglycerol kinase family lipid kinase [Bacteroidales bacterium]|nr:diacylglycerol kinase family lipid kinase [Bacteroidales bacterium]